METMNIVFSSDKNYTQLMGVALYSIFENKKGNYPIDIYVLDGGILKKDIKRLNILENKYNFKIKYIKIDTSLFKDFHTKNFYTQAVYYRIIIPRLLPHLKKVLYLDCDIVVQDDIYELYNTDINNYLFAAIEDIFTGKKRHELLNIPLKEKYFNSGVLLMNIEKSKEINAPETILKFVNDYPEKLKYCDQDAINSTMCGNFLCMEQKYNYIANTEVSTLDKFFNLDDIKIIHYAGTKPWNFFDNDIFIKKYFYYLNKTPWRNLKYINFYKGRKRIFFINLSSYFESKLPSILPKNNIERIRRLKRKLGIKLY
jgi:lipopolysaccharide biosynthesis glycosyltransferase